MSPKVKKGEASEIRLPPLQGQAVHVQENEPKLFLRVQVTHRSMAPAERRGQAAEPVLQDCSSPRGATWIQQRQAAPGGTENPQILPTPPNPRAGLLQAHISEASPAGATHLKELWDTSVLLRACGEGAANPEGHLWARCCLGSQPRAQHGAVHRDVCCHTCSRDPSTQPARCRAAGRCREDVARLGTWQSCTEQSPQPHRR